MRIIDYSQSTVGRRASVDVASNSHIPHPIKQEQPETIEEDTFAVTAQPGDSNRIVLEKTKAPSSALTSLTSSPEAARLWPFEGLVEILTLDLGDAAWETRHGAAVGLREIFRLHGHGAGRLMDLDITENNKRNAAYLEDISLRCICVFLLDRFGDYVSDQVVAPIRESVAQLLGATLLHMSHASIIQVFRLLKRLVLQSEFSDSGSIWEVCHGGMLGIKYLVAVREDIFLTETDVLDGVFESVLHGLANHDDDVRAVAAATLVPVAEQFVSLRPSLVQTLIDTLWISLEELRDDLSASTGSVMDLLAKLFSFSPVLQMITQNAAADSDKSFRVLVPRLFPFLRHTIRGVRIAVLRALKTFLNVTRGPGTDWISSKALRLIFQNILFEQVDEIRELSLAVWTELISSVPPLDLRLLFNECLHQTTSLLFTPIGTSQSNIPMDSSLIVRPSGQTMLLETNTPEKAPNRKTKKQEVTEWSGTQNKTHNVDSAVIRGDINLVGEEVMIKTRVTGAIALGQLIAAWPIEVFSSLL